MGDAGEPVPVAIDGGSIKLGQLLKLASVVDQGAGAKQLLAERRVTVNGTVEDRRGRQLVAGDVVAVDLGDGPAGAAGTGSLHLVVTTPT